MRKIILSAVLSLAATGCAGNSISDSEVATSVVSGALNNTGGSAIGFYQPRKSFFDRALQLVNPISTAHAAEWNCTGGTLDPSFDGSAKNPYIFTPLSCGVKFINGISASSQWSSTFTLNYGAGCDSVHALIWDQTAGCSVTRTTAPGGNTRTITGPNGDAYSVTHDTNGAGTGWTTVANVPTNAGVVVTCASGTCEDGATLVVNGSHITGTVTARGGTATPLFDHTLTTSATGLTVTGGGSLRSIDGTITVQHNLAKDVGTSTFNKAVFGDPLCCFPTSGSVTTAFTVGSAAGKSETLTFTGVCGEASLVTTAGATQSVTLMHCL